MCSETQLKLVRLFFQESVTAEGPVIKLMKDGRVSKKLIILSTINKN